MLTINTNVNNLKLQRNLGSVNFAMQAALNRLSTGYRINNAEDDAAGLVISKALDVQTRGLNVANQNAQMAVNVLNVADGALAQMGELTMRIRDLAVQAANGGYSITERTALELEAKELTLSLKQLVNGTKFNEFDIFKSVPKGIITEEEALAQGYTVVKTAAELQAIATGNLSGKYVLMNDIDLSGIANWNAIGTNSNTFKGTFDGNGFTISNLKMDKAINNQGLFGYTNNATIKNVGLENVDINSTSSYTGSLAGYAYGSTIANCYAAGNITGTDNTGGLVGWASNSTIANCYAAGNITGTDNTGGLVGYSNVSNITNSYTSNNVTGSDNAGGFVGYFYGGSTENSWSSGNITSASGATSSSAFGGFMGWASGGSVTSSCSTGQNNATTGYRGGFIGYKYNSPTSVNNNFVTQTNGYGGVGYGIDPGGITKQSSSYFTPTLIQSTLGRDAGSGQWDFMGSIPRLNWQILKNELTFQIGTDGSENSAISVDTGFSLGGFSASFADTDSARDTMVKCDELLKIINAKRGEVGANVNIIGSIIESNTVTNENLSASKSRIMDADVAKESANMIKNQILEKATTALLVQTKNVSGDLVLALLNGIRR